MHCQMGLVEKLLGVSAPQPDCPDYHTLLQTRITVLQIEIQAIKEIIGPKRHESLTNYLTETSTSYTPDFHKVAV